MQQIKEKFERRRARLERKLERLEAKEAQALERLENQEARAKARIQHHEESISRDLAGVPGHFAHGINFYKLFWVFFICCFLGVVVETIFVFLRTGHYMQRTGLVWGPFNLIYGIGAVLLTLCLHRLQGKNDRWIFLGGAVIGGTFEYFCSWLQETVVGTVSWDYSDIPFNLNGRINLLYCFFWGALGLVWIKELYPRISGWIERHLPKTSGVVITWLLAAFMLVNSLVSGGAVLRMAQRYEGQPAVHAWQQRMDERFPDERLERIYPSMVHTEP